jgi:hypothetical protein
MTYRSASPAGAPTYLTHRISARDQKKKPNGSSVAVGLTLQGAP